MTPTVLISYSARSKETGSGGTPPAATGIPANAGLLDLWNEDRGGRGRSMVGSDAGGDRPRRRRGLFGHARYLASKFCTMEEVPWLLQRRQERGMVLLPVVVRHWPWK